MLFCVEAEQLSNWTSNSLSFLLVLDVVVTSCFLGPDIYLWKHMTAHMDHDKDYFFNQEKPETTYQSFFFVCLK